ncbi:MAG TPA: PEGA domain-containing protein [Ignavibacteriaceae bacterium]|nr:PEGA domain-containing protein [Ignavibacteriaceae bacterium]
MKATKTSQSISVILILSVLISGCASSTLFQTEPSNASVYISGFKMGSTPYVYTDRKLTGSKTAITFKKEGYKEHETTLKRNERGDTWAVLGGIMFMIPFLWVMKYDPIHSYVLEKEDYAEPGILLNNHSNYLKAEDEQIIVKIDSIKRSASLPNGLGEEIERIMNTGAGYNIATRTFQPYFEMHEPYKDNDYILIYLTVNEKKDFNLKGFSEPRFRQAYLKDTFGELHGNMVHQGPFTMSYGGNYVQYNPNLISAMLKNELFIFEIMKKQVPIQMQLNYNYRENTQLEFAKIEINLVKD